MGNQMFQYAAALALARLRNTEVSFDLSILKEHQGFALCQQYSSESLQMRPSIRVRPAYRHYAQIKIGRREIDTDETDGASRSGVIPYDPAFLDVGPIIKRIFSALLLF
jgi:hypothetical protein